MQYAMPCHLMREWLWDHRLDHHSCGSARSVPGAHMRPSSMNMNQFGKSYSDGQLDNHNSDGLEHVAHRSPPPHLNGLSQDAKALRCCQCCSIGATKAAVESLT